MRLIIEPDYEKMSEWAANYVASHIINAKPTPENPFVLGCPTGGSPLGMYKHLIKLHQQGILSFKNVVTFNMDEYVGIPREHPQSYHTFMWSNFFSHIDIPAENVNILDGNAKDLKAECQAFEDKIRSYGGIDLFLGGVGGDGHIAFNEPGSSLTSRTRIKTLTKHTIEDNARFFGGDITQVPKTALTVGVGTIMDARTILLLVSGLSKAHALQQGVEGAVSQQWPITALQLHPYPIIVADEAACNRLMVGTYHYFQEIEEGHTDPATQLKI